MFQRVKASKTATKPPSCYILVKTVNWNCTKLSKLQFISIDISWLFIRLFWFSDCHLVARSLAKINICRFKNNCWQTPKATCKQVQPFPPPPVCCKENSYQCSARNLELQQNWNSTLQAAKTCFQSHNRLVFKRIYSTFRNNPNDIKVSDITNLFLRFCVTF